MSKDWGCGEDVDWTCGEGGGEAPNIALTLPPREPKHTDDLPLIASSP